jgi:hypothetical protein
MRRSRPNISATRVVDRRGRDPTRGGRIVAVNQE